MDSGAASTPPPSTSRKWRIGRRALGIGLLLLTVFLWTISNFLTSSIFSDQTFDNPFFLTYINNTIFAISAIPILIQYVLENGGFSNIRNIAAQAWEDRYKGFDPIRTDSEGHDEEEGQRSTVDDRTLGEDGQDNEQSNNPNPGEKLGFRETSRLSLEFCLLWFVANYFASACLEYTSVASATVLTSTSSIWTLIFCAVLRIEPFSVRKLAGVLASILGVGLISMVDLSGSDNDDSRGDFPLKSRKEIAIGDMMALISAVVYGVYVVVMKIRIGDEERVNMRLFFGLVGIYNLLFLWPIFLVLHFARIEPFELPPTGQVWGVIIVNSIASFIGDVSWAYAMLLTTPLVVTVGLSLNIPMSIIGDIIQYGRYSSALYWVGAVVVLASFIFINHESRENEEPDKPRSEAVSTMDDGI